MIIADRQSDKTIISGKGVDLINEFVSIVTGFEKLLERKADREEAEQAVDFIIEQARQHKRAEHKQESQGQEALSKLIAEVFMMAMKEDK